MKNTMKAKETTTRVRNSSNHWPWWRGLLFIELLLGLAVLAVSPLARAVSPPPDGGYSGLNTAEGTDALFSLTTGESNTGMGRWGATPQATRIRPPVVVRFLAIALAITTPLRVLAPLLSAQPPATIPLQVIQRLVSTRQEPEMWLTVRTRFIPTMVATIQPTVIKRSKKTRVAATTPPLV